MLLYDDRNVTLKKLKIKKIKQKMIRTEENKTNQRIEVVFEVLNIVSEDKNIIVKTEAKETKISQVFSSNGKIDFWCS